VGRGFICGYDCYDRQLNNKAGYLRVKTKIDGNMYVTCKIYLFNIRIDFMLLVSTYDLVNHQTHIIYNSRYKVNFPNKDPYHATGVCCFGGILICRVTLRQRVHERTKCVRCNERTLLRMLLRTPHSCRMRCVVFCLQ
jgi:hypothetical protein